MDSIIWRDESDSYTQRALKQAGGDTAKLFAHHRTLAGEVRQVLDSIGFAPGKILDLGCGYGGGVQAFAEHYPEAEIEGVDPGEESVAMARSLVNHPRAAFRVGVGHDLPFADQSFDLVILVMVLQWVPRAFLARTVAEVERVVRTGGLALVCDFLPNKRVMSQSRHNDQVYIFKDDYKRFFTAYPWMRLVHQYTKRTEMGPDYQFSFSFIKKCGIEEVYTLVPGPTEN